MIFIYLALKLFIIFELACYDRPIKCFFIEIQYLNNMFALFCTQTGTINLILDPICICVYLTYTHINFVYLIRPVENRTTCL